MRFKPLRINWEKLEDAFDSRNADLVSYVDRVTGHVALDIEEDDRDDDEEYEPAEPVARFSPGSLTRAYVEPLSSEQKLQWVGRFLEDVDDLEPDFADEMVAALDSENPTDAVLSVLNRYPEGKELWYLYRAERLHELVEQWVRDQGIECLNPPPWRE